jgi:hypothetical protein
MHIALAALTVNIPYIDVAVRINLILRGPIISRFIEIRRCLTTYYLFARSPALGVTEDDGRVVVLARKTTSSWSDGVAIKA